MTGQDASDDRIVGGFPPPNFPVVFADGVMSITNSRETVKFYLFRHEPDFKGKEGTIPQSFAQVVLSMDAFANMATFFEAALKKYIEVGLVTQDRVEELRAAHVGSFPKP